MSRIFDALRRAEEDKQAGSEHWNLTHGLAPDGLSVEPSLGEGRETPPAAEPTMPAPEESSRDLFRLFPESAASKEIPDSLAPEPMKTGASDTLLAERIPIPPPVEPSAPKFVIKDLGVAVPATTTALRRGDWWRVTVLAACLLVVYAPVLSQLAIQWWSDPDYSHGFLVPLFSAYVLWRRRDRLRQVVFRPSWIGMVILCGSLFLLFAGSLGAELFLQRISLLGAILGLTVWLWGWRLARAAAFPLGLLVMMIPLPAVIYYQLVFPLQILASQLATWILHALNWFSVRREGNILVLPSTRLEVAEACSGLRSLLSLMTIAAMYAYLAEKNNLTRCILCLLVLPIAVAGNAGRVVFAAISAELAGASAVEGWAHFLSGLFLFFFSTLLLVLCHALIVGASRCVASLRRRA